MKIIIYKTDNGIAKIIPAKNIDIETQIKHVPKGVEYKIVDTSDIPEDKDFYRALTYDLTLDINKAKEIQKDKIRELRKPLLEALDIEVMKNISDSEKISEIETQKQPLRDITLKVDACKTLEEIRAVKI